MTFDFICHLSINVIVLCVIRFFVVEVFNNFTLYLLREKRLEFIRFSYSKSLVWLNAKIMFQLS